MKTKLLFLLSLTSICYGESITYRNHDTKMGYTVYVFETLANNDLDILDVVPLPAGEMSDSLYDQTLKTIGQMVIVSRKGETRTLQNPFAAIDTQDCTVHIYKNKVEILPTFASVEQ